MKKILLIGSTPHEQADIIEWTKPFGDNLEKYDCIIIDLTYFPKDYPRTLFTNIGILKRTSRIFMRDYKKIFCIMDKPFNILFKEIPLNFAWMPFPQKLTVNPMLLGKTINIIDENFAEYFKNVLQWDNELHWQDTDNICFDAIATNKENNPIAATITMLDRGKIHFLPKPTKSNHLDAIGLLINLSTKNQTNNCPEQNQIEPQVFEQKIEEETTKDHRNLFSSDDRKITGTVFLILEEIGIPATTIYDIPNPNGVQVQVISSKGQVEINDPKVNRAITLIENQRYKTKNLVVANTYKDQPLENRKNQPQIGPVAKLFFETNNTVFMTTQSLYGLWKKVIKKEISIEEASTLIMKQNGEIQI
ncbi:MAG: hypothetical protein IAX21_10390 [Candidatus Bathyarchaeota archaeon]|nr:hypothetical protein [Candidatus Bathyarchaeum tardum]WGM88718.1 MAG: hypothetical protein NUK63_07285 [Candidatus Bathyarchaeum tardum]WNZ29028.1 MAG: hypothetical protein IAX21_10390 [Candidatus Bathyarchaeota archaeon]